MKVAIGIDGGGTKTSTCCVDIDTKKVLSVVKTGSSNWNSVGFDKSKEALHQGIFDSLKQANVDVSQRKLEFLLFKRC